MLVKLLAVAGRQNIPEKETAWFTPTTNKSLSVLTYLGLKLPH